jgi:AraC-like DNA-binding protein
MISTRTRLIIAFIIIAFSCSKEYKKDIVIDNFESGNYDSWFKQGVAFSKPLSSDSLPYIKNKKGDYFANSKLIHNGGYKFAQGKLSKKITIQRKYIEFLLAGGKHTTRQCVVLLMNNKIVRTATGNDDHIMRKSSWNVEEYIGQDATIEIVDAIDNGRENIEAGITSISIDNIIQTNKIDNDRVIFENFENDLKTNWEITGNAFTINNKQNPIYYPIIISNYKGNSFLTSYNPTDLPTGVLKSRIFTISHNYINFYIAGGKHPQRTCVNLIIDKKIVFSATGENSGNLKEVSWNVKDFLGKPAQIHIIDNQTQEWGHIIVDDISFTNNSFKTTVWFALIFLLIICLASIIIKFIIHKNKQILDSKFQHIDSELRNNKLYLDKSLKIKNFCKQFNCEAAPLNKFTQNKYKLDFTTYLNKLRVDYFKKEIIKNENKDLKIITVAENSGFKSKTSFYRIFKEIEGTTPTEYIHDKIVE